MTAVYSQLPSSMSLLLQCSYRSKICPNPRATKTDGTLHRLCEFHRRKANLSQLRLHNRKRKERAERRRSQSAIAFHRTNDACPAPQFPLESIYATPDYLERACQTPPFRIEPSIVNPIPYRAINAAVADKKRNKFRVMRSAPTNFTPEELKMLELLLLK